MQQSERFRVLLFVAVVAAVYVLAAGALVRIALARTGRYALPPGRAHRWTRRGVLALAGVGLLCIAYGYFVEPYRVDITRVRIESRKLAPGARPVRIVHISDLHSDPEPRLEERLPDVIAEQRPDVIVFTGDSINSPEGLPVLRRCITRLAAVAPTFVVRGNWDAWFWPDIDLFGGTGARELAGETVSLDVGGTPLSIVGVPVDSVHALDGSPLPDDPVGRRPGDFVVYLYHYPDRIYDVSRQGVDLYCAGHTHGGQVALPFYGALITFSKYGKRFESGLHRVGETSLYVNRGIGMEGGDAPRVRFWAPPEVTVIDVVPPA